MTPSNGTAAPAALPVIRTTRGGVSLETFDDVKLFKNVPEVSEVTSVAEALERVGNDEKKLFSIIRAGLNAAAVEAARESSDGWLLIDDSGKDTTEVFAGTLVSSEILNPLVLTLAKLSHDYDEIESKDPKSAEKKRAAKDAALEDIKQNPKMIESLKKKQLALQAKGEA